MIKQRFLCYREYFLSQRESDRSRLCSYRYILPMEQRFTYQGEQYEPRSFDYQGKSYVMDTRIPSGPNYWNEPTTFDTRGGYEPFKGLDNFHFFYASNTGIPGPFRPRPVKPQTDVKPNGISQLFHETQNLQYSTEDGKSPQAPFPNHDDPLIRQYNIMGGIARENCGCGASPLFPNM